MDEFLTFYPTKMQKESPLSKILIWYHLSLPLHSVNACSIEVMLVVNQKMDHSVSAPRHFLKEERRFWMKNLDNDGTECKKGCERMEG